MKLTKQQLKQIIKEELDSLGLSAVKDVTTEEDLEEGGGHEGQSCAEAHPKDPSPRGHAVWLEQPDPGVHDLHTMSEGGYGGHADIEATEQGTGPYASSAALTEAEIEALLDALLDDIVGPVDYKVYTPDGHLFGTFKINPDNELLDLEKLQRSFETLISDGFRVERVNLKE